MHRKMAFTRNRDINHKFVQFSTNLDYQETKKILLKAKKIMNKSLDYYSVFVLYTHKPTFFHALHRFFLIFTQFCSKILKFFNNRGCYPRMINFGRMFELKP